MKASLRKIKDQLPKIYIFKKIRMMAEISFAIDFRVISLFLRNMVAKLVKKKKEQRIRKRGKQQPINRKSTIGFVRFLTQISLKNLEGGGSVFH